MKPKVNLSTRGIVPHREYTIPEVLSLTGISRSHLYNLMDDGRIQFSKPATHRVIPGQHVLRIINKAI